MCGYTATTTGRPCANYVGADVPSCRAGHPCLALRDGVMRIGPRNDSLRACREPQIGADRGRRAAELLGRALTHDDAQGDGVSADQVLADPVVALALLGSPVAASAARDAVVQRFGLVGALLVVGYEERWCRRVSVLAGGAESPVVGDVVGRCVERLVRHFVDLDCHRIEALLRDIDRAEGRATVGAATARCRLHATYAVAARDGDDSSHHAYMEALDRVLLTTRPALAS
jgi:hypothetical protein